MKQWQIEYIIRFYIKLLEVPLFLWTVSIFFYLYLYTLVTGSKGTTLINDTYGCLEEQISLRSLGTLNLLGTVQCNRTKQSIEIENFFDWIVSTQSKSGGGIEVADYNKSDLTSRYHISLKNDPKYIK